MRRLVVLPLLALLPLTGCAGGGDNDASSGSRSTPSTESSASSPADDDVAPEPPEEETYSVPDCADIWTEGQVLDANYEGCMEGGNLIAAVSFPCDDGRRLHTYESVEPNLFAFSGGPIQAGGAADANYAAAYEEC